MPLDPKIIIELKPITIKEMLTIFAGKKLPITVSQIFEINGEKWAISKDRYIEITKGHVEKLSPAPMWQVYHFSTGKTASFFATPLSTIKQTIEQFNNYLENLSEKKKEILKKAIVDSEIINN